MQTNAYDIKKINISHWQQSKTLQIYMALAYMMLIHSPYFIKATATKDLMINCKQSHNIYSCIPQKRNRYIYIALCWYCSTEERFFLDSKYTDEVSLYQKHYYTFVSAKL